MNDEYTLIIRDISGRKRLQIASWKYYEVVDYLRAVGISQEESYVAGKWAARAKPGETMKMEKLIFEIEEEKRKVK